MSFSDTPQWGLDNPVTPRFGARLVQEGHRLHFLADRASLHGTFDDATLRRLERVFPIFIERLECLLSTGELTPRSSRCVTVHHDGLTCEADTLGSCGYVYIAVYPTPLPDGHTITESTPL